MIKYEGALKLQICFVFFYFFFRRSYFNLILIPTFRAYLEVCYVSIFSILLAGVKGVFELFLVELYNKVFFLQEHQIILVACRNKIFPNYVSPD